MILILVSQRAEVHAILLFGTERMRKALEEQLQRQRGNGPSPLEWIVVVYVLGMYYKKFLFYIIISIILIHDHLIAQVFDN